ncbi:putative integral membrane protein [Streptomyces viridochromogenes Tue57]|uniref:Putative integral membrane protein n=1 Tax=Streptomyces viridochromogenes Tue57 TaxID=1160705 RepID=L8PFY6_STRVR|nr:putative integral membrane protein [Streptomyces viridochromogenes Tue57]
MWLGGLTTLLVVLVRAPADDPLPSAAVARFSRLALASVAVLVATGVYLSWRGLGSWEAFTTPYGRTLALKAGAVGLMLVAASYSRNWTRRLLRIPQAEPVPVPVTVGGGDQDPPPDRTTGPGRSPDTAEPGPEAQRRGLRRSVLAEVLIGVVVLVATTVLTGSQQGRADAETVAASRVPGRPDVVLTTVPYDTGGPGPVGSGTLQITLEPGRVGRNVVQAVALSADGDPLSVPELRLTARHAANGVGPLDAELVSQSGYWGSDTLNLPVAGTWTMRATVRTSDIDQVTVEETVEVTR